MAVPMRSTDFRAIVEPIMNEDFDGIYDQRKDEWKVLFDERRGTPRNYHEEVVLYGMSDLFIWWRALCGSLCIPRIRFGICDHQGVGRRR